MYWVRFRVCVWMILLILLFNREVVEEEMDCVLENLGFIFSFVFKWFCGFWICYIFFLFNVL